MSWPRVLKKSLPLRRLEDDFQHCRVLFSPLVPIETDVVLTFPRRNDYIDEADNKEPLILSTFFVIVRY